MEFLFSGLTDIVVTDGLRMVVDEHTKAPCRRCLRDATPGEEVFLTSHDPFDADSPYRCSSPIFVHVRDCSAYAGTAIPEQLRIRLLSVRSFDEHAMMLDADIVDGAELGAALERMFADPNADVVHVHNARPGCFAARVQRMPPVVPTY